MTLCDRSRMIVRRVQEHPGYPLAMVAVTGFIQTMLYKTIIMQYAFDFTLTLMLVEAIVTLVVMELLRRFKVIQVLPYTIGRAYEMLVPSVCYCMFVLFWLNSMAGMTIPMHTTLKRLIPFSNLTMVWSFHRKSLPGKHVCLAVLVVAVGGFLGDAYELVWDHWSYMYTGLSILSQCVCLNWVDWLAKNSDGMTVYDQVYLNMFNLILLLLYLDTLDDELREVVVQFMDSSVWFFLLFAIIIAVSIWNQITIFRCAAIYSALTASVADQVRWTLDILIGYVVGMTYFNEIHYKWFNVAGCVICLTGIWMYYRSGEVKPEALSRR